MHIPEGITFQVEGTANSNCKGLMAGNTALGTKCVGLLPCCKEDLRFYLISFFGIIFFGVIKLTYMIKGKYASENS